MVGLPYSWTPLWQSRCQNWQSHVFLNSRVTPPYCGNYFPQSEFSAKHLDGCVTISSKWCLKTLTLRPFVCTIWCSPNVLWQYCASVLWSDHLPMKSTPSQNDVRQNLREFFCKIRIPTCQTPIESVNGRWSPNGRRRESNILGSRCQQYQLGTS